MSATAAELVSVLVVAADSGEDLQYCVDSVLESSSSIELIVSDNHSTDGSLEAIEGKHGANSRLRILRNNANLGFGAGCNRAATIATGHVLLMLNPDCVVDRDTIARLRAVLDGSPEIGLVGATIVDRDGRYEPASRRHDPLLRRALMTKSGLARFQRNARAFSGANIVDSPRASIEDVDAVSGALMMIRKNLFDRIGGFDEGYFLHCEDLDLCRRVRDAGARVVCANDIRVVHAKGTSSRSRPVFVARHKHRGMWRWFDKFDPAARNPFLRALVWVGLWSHFVLMMPRYLWKRQR